MPFSAHPPQDPALRRRRYLAEAEIALSALDCLLNGERAIYASSELTTGRRFYDLVREHRPRQPELLREVLGEAAFESRLWQPNIAAAASFARDLRRQIGSGELVVTPAHLWVDDWSQPEYLEFWERMLRTRLKAAYFNQGWQFSNGCTFELKIACELGLPTFDHRGRPLSAERGVELIATALADLAEDGIDAPLLAANLDSLRSLATQRG